MSKMLAIARKELRVYLSSATALVFVGAFLLLTLFIFFWVDAFWSRGLADVRPLFNRMPLMLLVLVSALTMRQWSEEQRSGTQEVLLTLPVRRIELVLGKLLAVVALVALTLALTLFLPLSVSFLGNLDWGPVAGGYLAALLLAAAYAAVGLFISSRTDNQIVAFIATALACGALYIIGAGDLSSLAGAGLGAVLRALSTSSRFESIQRGVIDLRDLVYYLTLTGVFVAANVLSLQAKTWSTGAARRRQRRQTYAAASLVMANLVLLNVWLAPLRGLRWDLTQQREFTLSDTTRQLLGELQEPLEITAYLSEQTHPLLEPLEPQLEDMLHEYAVAGSRVRVAVLDPAQDAEREAEANSTYGIQPTAFQVAGRNETSIINSYFDVLVRYGDQTETLGFRDLVEVTSNRDGSVEVGLSNLEYTLTSTIKRVVYGFQSVDAALAALTAPAQLTLYLTSSTLPTWLAEAPTTVAAVAGEYAAASPNFAYQVVDLDDPAAGVTAQELYDQYGLQPVRVSLLSTETYYFYLVLRVGDNNQVVYPSGAYAESDVRAAIEAALKRSAPGFLKVVGLWMPAAAQDYTTQTSSNLTTYYEAAEALAAEYQVTTVDLTGGAVPASVDVLVLVAPQGMTELERFAVDQYLMRGGAVIAVAGNYGITLDQYQGGLALAALEGGVRDLLLAYGIDVQQALVLDPQNEPFPVTVNRQVGSYTVQELQAMDYPFFVDIRAEGMAADHPVVAGLSAVTLNWASPVVVDAQANAARQVETLMSSSAQSWLQTDTNINPDFTTFPDYGFAVVAPQQSYPLAVAVTGSFASAYRESGVPAAQSAEDAKSAPVDVALIEESPATARLVVLGSAEFLNDTVFAISSQLTTDRHSNSIQLIQNAISWCVEDEDLLQIRARGTATHVLFSLSEQGQRLWEWGNYGVALAALLVLGVWWRSRLRHEEPLPLIAPGQHAAATEQNEGGPR